MVAPRQKQGLSPACLEKLRLVAEAQRGSVRTTYMEADPEDPRYMYFVRRPPPIRDQIRDRERAAGLLTARRKRAIVTRRRRK